MIRDGGVVAYPLIPATHWVAISATRGRGAFPHDDAIKKLLYLGLRNASKK